MSNREDAKVFTVVTYRRDGAGNTYRLRESVRDGYTTEDGGWEPQRALWGIESFVYSTDTDAATAERYCDELDEAEAMGAGG